MPYTVLDRGKKKHKCSKPSPPSWQDIFPGAVLKCLDCGQHWRLSFEWASIGFWRRVKGPVDA